MVRQFFPLSFRETEILSTTETTAHTLAFAFALLALYPKIQDELYEDVMNALPEIGEPVRLAPFVFVIRKLTTRIPQSYEDYSKLVRHSVA